MIQKRKVELVIEGFSQCIIILLATWIHIPLAQNNSINAVFYLSLLDSMFMAWAFIFSYTFKGSRYLDISPYREELTYTTRITIYVLIYLIEVLVNFNIQTAVIKKPEYIMLVIQLLTCPFIFNWMYENTDIVKMISYNVRKIQYKIVKKSTCMLMANVLNMVCKNSLQMNGKIHYKELYPLVGNSDVFSNNCQILLKSLFISIILKEVKSKSNIVTDKIVKYIYSYNTGEKLRTYKDKKSAKKMCIEIFNKRKWNELMKPNNLYAVLYLFENDTELDLSFIKDETKFLVLKVVTVWSVSRFFNGSQVAIIISTIFMIYRDLKASYTKTKLGLVCVQIIASCIGIYYRSGLLSSVLSEVIGFVITYGGKGSSENNVSGSVSDIISLSKVLRQVYNVMITAINNKRYFFYVLSTVIYISLPKYVRIMERETMMAITYAGTTFFILINIQNVLHFFTILYIILVSYLTEFNTVQVIYNSMVLYMLINIYNYMKIKDKLVDNTEDMIISYKHEPKVTLGSMKIQEPKPMSSPVPSALPNLGPRIESKPNIVDLSKSIKENYV